jgi:hypothetical protein
MVRGGDICDTVAGNVAHGLTTAGNQGVRATIKNASVVERNVRTSSETAEELNVDFSSKGEKRRPSRYMRLVTSLFCFFY